MGVENSEDGRSVPEIIAWLVFCATSAQLVFQTPSIIVVPWQRANVFSALLCAVTLFCALSLTRRKPWNAKFSEILISVALLVLAGLSSLLSDVPKSAGVRAFVIMASALGGFWTARMLLSSPARLRQFQWLCAILLSGLIIVSLIGYFFTGIFEYFIAESPHSVISTLFLLSFGPLALLLGRPVDIVSFLCIGLLAAVGVVIYYSGLRAAYLIPVILLLIAFALKAIRLRYVLIIIVIMAVLAPLAWQRINPVKHTIDNETHYYRLENYPFALHIALKHPLFGIGPRAPRDSFLDDYRIRYPYVTEKQFRDSLVRIVTSDNSSLTLVVDMGLPFTFIYGVSVIVLLLRLVGRLKVPWTLPFHPLALFLPIVASVVYYQLFDGLYYPQLSWFFHILLALIPRPEVTENDNEHGSSWITESREFGVS